MKACVSSQETAETEAETSGPRRPPRLVAQNPQKAQSKNYRGYGGIGYTHTFEGGVACGMRFSPLYPTSKRLKVSQKLPTNMIRPVCIAGDARRMTGESPIPQKIKKQNISWLFLLSTVILLNAEWTVAQLVKAPRLPGDTFGPRSSARPTRSRRRLI